MCPARAIKPVDGRPAVIELPLPAPGPAEVRIRDTAAAAIARAFSLWTFMADLPPSVCHARCRKHQETSMDEI